MTHADWSNVATWRRGGFFYSQVILFLSYFIPIGSQNLLAYLPVGMTDFTIFPLLFFIIGPLVCFLGNLWVNRRQGHWRYLVSLTSLVMLISQLAVGIVGIGANGL